MSVLTRWIVAATLASLLTACGSSAAGDVTRTDSSKAAVSKPKAYDYAGHNPDGIPNYLTRQVPPEDSLILRRAYGIENPHRLYVSDSTENGTLKYDTKTKACRSCLVNTYDVGYRSIRGPDESWEEAERRVYRTPHRHFRGSRVPQSRSVADLDPTIRPAVEQMLIDARRQGFNVHVIGTYRSPRRQAFLMSLGRARTHTLTSPHSYGRAVDVVVDDGRRGNRRTRRNWIAFRTWVVNYRGPNGERFTILGRPNSSWDWPHIEVRRDEAGFRSIDEALARGRACLRPGSKTPCEFQPVLPERVR